MWVSLGMPRSSSGTGGSCLFSFSENQGLFLAGKDGADSYSSLEESNSVLERIWVEMTGGMTSLHLHL